MVTDRNRGARSRRVGAILAAMAVLALGAGSALAELPGPAFMPGFPVVAGPQAIMMWQPVPGAVKYRVYLDGKMIGETNAFQYMAELPTEGDHVYQVVAVDKDGKEGARGKDYKYAVQKLEKPKNLAALPRENSLVVRWDPVKTALIYDVQRATTADGPYQLITSTQDLTYTDSAVKQGQTYYYRVSAKNAAGLSSEFSTPLMFKIEAVAVAESVKMKIIMTKLLWENFGIQNALDVLFLPKNAGVAVTSAVQGKSSLMIYDMEGKPVSTMLPPPEKAEQVEFFGLGASSDGNLWVVSHNSMDIFKFNPKDGSLVTSFEVEPLPNTRTPYAMYDVVEGPGGDLFVSEQRNSLILVVNKGKIVRTIGKVGGQPGELSSPLFLDVLKGDLVVVDGANNRVQIFGFDGTHKAVFGTSGGAEAGTFLRISGLAVDPDAGRVLVGDRGTGNVQAFEGSGKYYAMFSNEDGSGQMKALPIGMRFSQGKLAVANPMAGKIQLFSILGEKEITPGKK